jgi:hypothetical protein
MPLASRCLGVAFAVLLGSFSFCGAAFRQAGGRPPGERAQLAVFGERGITIAVAREKVLEILQGQNSCSAWFRQADRDSAAVFEGLGFTLDLNGPRYITGFKTEFGETAFKHPYAASVGQNAGRGAVITLNANGPFFVGSTAVLQREFVGAYLQPAGWRNLLVDNYIGNTLAAQMTTLLHELGHVIGRIPEDFEENSGQSGRNTAEVLRYCRAQIRASARSDRLVVVRLGD